MLLEPDATRRAQMGAHFAVPDAHDLAVDNGRHDLLNGLHGCTHARIAEAVLLVGDTETAMAYVSDDAMCMQICHGASLSAARLRGQALVAMGDRDGATVCLEKAAAGAVEVGMFMQEVQAVLAMVTCGLGGSEAHARLGGLVRKLESTGCEPAQVADLLRDRNGALAADVGALLRDGR